MKNIFLICFIIFTSNIHCQVRYAGQDFRDGFKAGYIKGFCAEEYGCSVNEYSIQAPRPNPGYDSYDDGYTRGVAAGAKAKNGNSSSGLYKISEPPQISGQINDNLNYEAIGAASSSGNQPIMISDETANQIGQAFASAIKAGQIKNAKKRLRFNPEKYRKNPTLEMAFSIYNDAYTLTTDAGISIQDIRDRYGLEDLFISEHINTVNLYEGNYKLYQKEIGRKIDLIEKNKKVRLAQERYYFSDVAIKIALLRDKHKEDKSEVSLNKIDQFKYAVILESELFNREIDERIKKKWSEKLPELVIIENDKSIPNELNLNPNLALYIDISADGFYEMFTETRVFIYDNESNLLFKKIYSKKSASRSIKLFVDELNGLNYRYDKSLVKKYVKKVNKEKKLISNAVKINKPVKPVSSNKDIITKSNIKYSLTKKEAIEEIKSLKDLLDSNILTKEEYEKRAEILKRIILKN
jgi:hypothetical protein